MDRCTSTLLTAIVEVGDIVAPATFIILPAKLGEGEESMDNMALLESVLALDEVTELSTLGSRAEEYKAAPLETRKKWMKTARNTMRNPEEALAFVNQLEESVEKAQAGIEEVSSFLSDPFSYGKQKAKEAAESVFANYTGDDLWLYLVDEYTGKPVVTKEGGDYPIKITLQSGHLKAAMPYMKLGVKAMKMSNGIAGVARMFGVPAPKIPQDVLKKAEKEVGLMDQESTVAEFEVLQAALDDGGGRKRKCGARC